MLKKRRWFCLFLMASFLINYLLLPSFVQAQPNNQNIYTQKNEVLSQQKISELEKNKENILSELVAIQTSINRLKKSIPQLDAESFLAEEEIKLLNKNLDETQLRLEEKTSILNNKLKYIYTSGNFNPFCFLLTVENFNEFFDNFFYLKSLAKQDSKLIESIHKEEDNLNKTKEEIEVKQKQIIRLIEQSQQKKDILKKQLEQKESSLAQVDSKLEDNLSSIIKRIERIESSVSRGTKRSGTLRMLATGYCPCPICTGSGDGITAIGLKAGYGIAAVDPSVIPLGSRLYISGYGEAIAGDVGGKIKKNHIDLCFNAHQEALNWGKRWVIVEILD
ncbi:3D domain-containing protein [Candidatus Oleimmundimicrobium sp.]|uniref:3D domain-containing protein n=1 Tax=Candidatus Oleimmundimicrobium sp. TaxID=3060597 RepID=UPI00271F8ED7|nr:3D domain-containing protein [Candidatus Oleimmundimicrobium sp.]MDO8885687.1 3D domain-containing protein [Candidatus Oleimmundimicrobium sp.]